MRLWLVPLGLYLAGLRQSESASVPLEVMGEPETFLEQQHTRYVIPTPVTAP